MEKVILTSNITESSFKETLTFDPRPHFINTKD